MAIRCWFINTYLLSCNKPFSLMNDKQDMIKGMVLPSGYISIVYFLENLYSNKRIRNVLLLIQFYESSIVFSFLKYFNNVLSSLVWQEDNGFIIFAASLPFTLHNDILKIERR